jgi:hypothetical protein
MQDDRRANRTSDRTARHAAQLATTRDIRDRTATLVKHARLAIEQARQSRTETRESRERRQALHGSEGAQRIDAGRRD